MAEEKVYFSGSHKLCEQKVEISVLSTGLTIWCSLHYPGFVSDIKIFRENETFYEEASKMCVRDFHLNDEELFDDHCDEFWATIADKGYQKTADVLSVVHPVRVLICGHLTPSQVESSTKL